MIGRVAEINIAWESYNKVFKKLSKQVPEITDIELSQVSV